ncbi:PREDICTED: E3 ubiquitin-protein ligase TRIM69-like, partial [Gekko japonicus]|uniref:E3 ubiquitin-protein ligase TRIM69-like n=1 Tax=Gekko japonicus TaxID=146911 RepID=A0ABM1LEK7_GEKJA
PERFQNYPIVLGKSSFCSGEHYWEIETKDAADWAIGVATESIERKVRVPAQDIVGKVWALRLRTAEDIGPEGGTFSQRFGVYLDYDKGQVSFYDAKNYSHLHTRRAQFKEK